MSTICLQHDFHTHSVFSDGKATVAEMVDAAENAGLTHLGLADHVREDTTWVPDFVATVRKLRNETDVTLYVGVEAKISNGQGALDLPTIEGTGRLTDPLEGVDFILAADHRFPYKDTSLVPRDVKRMLASGETTKELLLEALVDAMIQCMHRYSNLPQQLIMAHAFSFLPKVGMSTELLTAEQLRRLAQAAVATRTWFEVDERWQAPTPHVVFALALAGVAIVASSDAHCTEDVGRYDYVRRIATMLADIKPIRSNVSASA